jgi:fatty-acyl-CoA synthase
MISADILGERARLTPDATALVVVDPPLRLTYRELDRRARACAQAWRNLGLGHGDRVALLAQNRVEYLEAFFAAGKTGIILVPLGTRLTAAELAPILADSGARALLYGQEHAEIAAALRETASAIETWIAFDPGHSSDPGEGTPPQDSDPGEGRGEAPPFLGSLPSPSAGRGAGGRGPLLDYAVLVETADPDSFAAVRCQPEDLYCLLYTSGTTGKPKGVMIPHRQIAWNGYNTACGWQLRPDDVSPIFTPLYHAGGLMAFLGPILTIGGTIVLHRGFDPAEIFRTIEKERCTIALGVPTIWKLLADAPEFAEADLSSLRCLMSGGAPLPTWLAEIWQQRGMVFKQGFGMTEVGVNCFAMTADDSRRKLGSIGKPMMFTEVALRAEEGSPAAAGEIGEMFFRGPHVSRGYWNNPEATAAAFTEDGFFRSGDLARRDEEGFFYIAGRAKDMIISGGVNVYPAEIEAILLEHPGVRDAALVGVEDQKWGEVGIAFVVPLEQGSAEPEALLEYLGGRLARFKLPREIVHLEELPRTAYGKVVKGDLRRQYLQGAR